MLPRPPLVLMFAVPALLSLVALTDESLAPMVWGANGLIVVLALLDAALGFRPKVDLKSESADVFSLGRNNKVSVHLRSWARRTLYVKVNADTFEHAELVDLPQNVMLPPGAEQVIDYQIVPGRRGAYPRGDHYLRIPTPLGLWDRQFSFGTNQLIRVYPDLQALRTFELLARQDREHAFLRATKLKGGESEFARLREYSRDDEYRAIDWKATAKRQRLTAREYQLESNQTVMFIIDAGRLMTAQAGKTTFFDHALNASLMLGQVAARNGDRVGLLGFDDAVRAFVPPTAGPSAARRLIQATYDLHPTLVEPDYDFGLSQFAVRVRKRSLVILFVQVVDEAVAEILLKRTHSLMPRHLPLLVLLRNPELDAFMREPCRQEPELYARAAGAELLRWRHGFVQDLRSQGALVLDVAPQQLTGELINRYLLVKARQLL